jgi:serine phosphatase RsbU (regulator of sigma subunit)
MKKLFSNIILITLLLLVFKKANAAEIKTIVISNESIKSFQHLAKDAYIYCDTSNKLNFHQIRTRDNLFERIPSNNLNLGFTNKTYWVKFKIRYIADQSENYYLEIARPITSQVILYHPNKFGAYEKKLSGDDFEFNKRDVPHRKSIFLITLYPNVENTFYVKLKSDGEVINLPIKLWKQEAFRDSDYLDQFFHGIYFGILGFVFIIYFFFYVALKEKSFIFYVLYVLNMALLQFSLEGFTFQFLFPYNSYLTNITLLLSACGSQIFVMLYAKSFLNIKERLPKFNSIFILFIILGITSAIMTVASTFTYELTFPLINTTSLLSTILILVSIIVLKIKRKYVCPFFITAFILLMLGATIFILSNLSLVPNSFLTENGLKLGSGLEVIFLSLSMAKKFRQIQIEKEKAQQLAYEKLQEVNRITQNINIELEKQVKQRTEEIYKQKILIEEKNKEITDSIRYAKRIQEAILPDINEFNHLFKESFIYFKPKDIVSGDFYWFKSLRSLVPTNNNEKVLKPLVVFAVADCTGHGVPGAFMSIIGTDILNESAKKAEINSPAEALDFLHFKLTTILNNKKNEEFAINDGMDIAMIAIDMETGLTQFAGANNPVWIFRKTDQMHFEFEEIKGDKQPIGAVRLIKHKPFTNHSFNLKHGDSLYIFSDGYADQFGGPEGKKFKYKKLKELLLSIQHEDMQTQKEILHKEFLAWKGDLDQVDDICIIGIRYS